MYQKNEADASDTAFLRVETLFTLLYWRYSLRTLFASKYPRAKLANDGGFVPPNQQFITPSIAKAEIVGLARQWEELGLMENVDQFKNDLVTERSSSDPDRLNAFLRPDQVNQLVTFAAELQFLL
jgi:phage tail sheath gpL-like